MLKKHTHKPFFILKKIIKFIITLKKHTYKPENTPIAPFILKIIFKTNNILQIAP